MQLFFYYIKLNLSRVNIEGQDVTSPDAKDTWLPVYFAKIASGFLAVLMPPRQAAKMDMFSPLAKQLCCQRRL
jgi:hypothetical protein